MDDWFNQKKPLSLDAQRMIIKAKLQSSRLNSIFPRAPSTIDGTVAVYQVIVRQYGAVIEGQYTLANIRSDDYRQVICIYYDSSDVVIEQITISSKPGYCTVSVDMTPDVTKLEIRVLGIMFAPTSGDVILDGSYAPTRSLTDFGNILSDANSNICTGMSVNPSNIATYGKIDADLATGASIWTITPTRGISNSFVRIQKINIQSLDNSIGTITIIPYIRINGAVVALSPLSGQANYPITGFRNNDNSDIIYVLITMRPSDPNRAVDAYQITVNIVYCYVARNPSTSSVLNGIQPYYMQNGLDNSYNQQIGMFILIFLLYFL